MRFPYFLYMKLFPAYSNPPAAGLFSGRLTSSLGSRKNARYVPFLHVTCIFFSSSNEQLTSMFPSGNIEGLKETKLTVSLEDSYYVVNNARAQPLF